MTAIAAGAYFSLLLDNTGQVWFVGRFNGNGELGQGPAATVTVQATTKAVAPANANVNSAGADHGLGLTKTGAGPRLGPQQLRSARLRRLRRRHSRPAGGGYPPVLPGRG
jgi:alpha-tubulin suppressor-like RCC1 family protein